jgi:IS5 family transposase
MNEQRTFAGLAWDSKRKVTRRERFLTDMDRVLPWTELLAVVRPHYPAPVLGRGVTPLERMLRIYFCQQWFDLGDQAMEDELYESESLRRFAGIALGEDAVPDETTILNFRHLLEAHALTAQLFEAVNALLEAKGLLLKRGTIVDATILDAPSSTKNATGTRDPEMRQTRKGNQWYFGMKAHIGTDPQGLVHTLRTTDAAEADINQLVDLLHGDEEVVHGDAAYASRAHEEMCAEVGIRLVTPRRKTRTRPLSPTDEEYNRRCAQRRAFVEHPFHTVKWLWGFAKVRYRGLAKNTVRLYAAFMLANIYRLRHRLRPGWATCL